MRAATESVAAGPGAHLADQLLSALGALPVWIESARVEQDEIRLAGYPDGARPTSTVWLEGAGRAGRGEHVGWTRDAHARFADHAAATSLSGRHVVGPLSTALRDLFPEPYGRAAVEAAAIELALAQNRTDLAGLVGAAPRPVRYVVSFDASCDPIARMRAERGVCPARELKIDVDPRWEDSVLDGIAAAGGVAILDFKGAGSGADHERFGRRFPAALLEDALAPETRRSAEMRDRVSLDAPIRTAGALAAMDPPPAAVNVKPARMGGVLEAIATVGVAARLGLLAYFGGMWEVGIGRRQLCALASLLCANGPNDIAPLTAPERRVLRLDPARAKSGFLALNDARAAAPRT